MSDVYDRGMAYLEDHPDELWLAWNKGSCPLEELDLEDLSVADEDGFCDATRLFMAATPSGRSDERPGDHRPCGCLTQIHSRYRHCSAAWTTELTQKIIDDDRLPSDEKELERRYRAASLVERRKLLEPFAEWQRFLDVEIRDGEQDDGDQQTEL